MNKNLSYVLGALVIVAIVVVVLVMQGNDSSTNTATQESDSTTGQSNTVSGADDTNSNTDNTVAPVTEKVIDLDASRWQYSQKVITVKVGDHVKININNLDTKHGISIPDLGVSGIDSVEFTADKAGTYQFRCPTMCGQGHMGMTGTLIVE